MADHDDDFDLPEPERERPRLPGTDAEQMLRRLHEDGGLGAAHAPVDLGHDQPR